MSIFSDMVSALNANAEQKQLEQRGNYIRTVRQILEDSPMYSDLGFASISCVGANHTDCGLREPEPNNWPNHVPSVGQRVIWNNRIGFLFQYNFTRKSDCPGGMRVVYSAIPVSQMALVLNQTIGNYTVQAGYGVVPIMAQRDLMNGRVAFYMAPFTTMQGVDWVALRNYLSALRNMYMYWGY